MTVYGQLVVGPPGSGKSTYCVEIKKILEEFGRKVAIINFDPANDQLPYEAFVDINDFIMVADVMHHIKLGPNGAMLFCMEFVEKHVDQIVKKVTNQADHYFLIDCPGQVELYTNHSSFKNILSQFEKADVRLCCVNLIDSHYCSDPGKFISTLLLSLTTMLHLALPHINILSKVDLMKKFGDKMLFQTDYYTRVLDLSYLVDALDEEPFDNKKYRKLNRTLASVIEDYALVQFHPIRVNDRVLLSKVINEIDKANGYVFKSDAERDKQTLFTSYASCNDDSQNFNIEFL